MPILIEEMEAEVVPERETQAPARDEERERREQRAQILERMHRELRIRDERGARWHAD
jgi:hypothetical protein